LKKDYPTHKDVVVWMKKADALVTRAKTEGMAIVAAHAKQGEADKKEQKDLETKAAALAAKYIDAYNAGGTVTVGKDTWTYKLDGGKPRLSVPGQKDWMYHTFVNRARKDTHTGLFITQGGFGMNYNMPNGFTARLNFDKRLAFIAGAQTDGGPGGNFDKVVITYDMDEKGTTFTAQGHKHKWVVSGNTIKLDGTNPGFKSDKVTITGAVPIPIAMFAAVHGYLEKDSGAWLEARLKYNKMAEQAKKDKIDTRSNGDWAKATKKTLGI